MVSDDPAAAQADDERLSDELFDALGAGHPPEGDQLAAVIDAWRAHIVAEPIPDPPSCSVVELRRNARPRGDRL